MLPAQHQGPEPQAEHGFGRLLHLGENRLRVAERNLNGTEIGKVAAVPNFGAGDLIEVRDPRGGDTYPYPFTRVVVPEVNIAGGFLIIVPPIEAEIGDEEPD